MPFFFCLLQVRSAVSRSAADAAAEAVWAAAELQEQSCWRWPSSWERGVDVSVDSCDFLCMFVENFGNTNLRLVKVDICSVFILSVEYLRFIRSHFGSRLAAMPPSYQSSPCQRKPR